MGWSTVLLLLGGALPPSSGRVSMTLRKHGVLYLPQSPERMFFSETVRREAMSASESRSCGAGTITAAAPRGVTVRVFT